jgi:branched-chain amino acid transport system ATP-binding protein
MFDEPSLGLAPVIVDDVFKVIVRINKEKNIPILLVEQNAFMALSISNRTYVLENGVITTSGNSSELIESDEIRKAYLGG